MEHHEIESQDSDSVEDTIIEKVWPRKVERYFIELLVEEVKKGSRKATTLSSSGWKTVKLALKEKFDKEYTHDQVKNKYNQLRSRQRSFKDLIKETGISYDSTTGKVNATDEHWKMLSKVHRMAKRFKRKGCKEYQDLCFIFGDTAAIVQAHPSPKSTSKSDDEGYNGKGNGNIYLLSKENEDVISGNVSESEPSDSSKSGSKKRARRTYSSILEKALTTIGEQSKRNNDLLERKLATSSSIGVSGFGATSLTNTDVSVMKECFKALNALGITGPPYGKAVKALHDSILYREIFLYMPDQRKKDWVSTL